LKQLFEKAGYFVRTEVICPYTTDCGITFGYGRIDLLVETSKTVFLIELKANVAANATAECQLRRYMKHYKTEKVKQGFLWRYNSNEKRKRVPIMAVQITE
jgi:Holliday junction resolvase-like predicted endonuclease